MILGKLFFCFFPVVFFSQREEMLMLLKKAPNKKVHLVLYYRIRHLKCLL